MSIFKSTHFLSLASRAIFRKKEKKDRDFQLTFTFRKRLFENFHITKSLCNSWRLHVDWGIQRLWRSVYQGLVREWGRQGKAMQEDVECFLWQCQSPRTNKGSGIPALDWCRSSPVWEERTMFNAVGASHQDKGLLLSSGSMPQALMRGQRIGHLSPAHATQ